MRETVEKLRFLQMNATETCGSHRTEMQHT